MFVQFQLKLLKQMLIYDPWNELYAGDDKFRCNKQLPKKRRRSKDLTGEETFPDTGVTLHNLKAAWQLPQFYSTIEDIQKHFESITKKTNQYTCEVCGKKTYWSCGLCQIFICLLDKHNWNSGRCTFLYYNDKFFGLARSDNIDVLGKSDKENGQRKTKDKIKKELALYKLLWSESLSLDIE